MNIIESLKEWQNLIGFILGVFAILGIGIPIGYRLGGIDSKLDLLDRKIENTEDSLKPSIEHIRNLVEGRDGLHVVRNDLAYIRNDFSKLEQELKERFPTADELKLRTNQMVSDIEKEVFKHLDAFSARREEAMKTLKEIMGTQEKFDNYRKMISDIEIKVDNISKELKKLLRYIGNNYTAFLPTSLHILRVLRQPVPF